VTKQKRNVKIKTSADHTCNFCSQEAEYDGKTEFGLWARMCMDCFLVHGVGLGSELGQRCMRLTMRK
jgi:ribosomal protein L37AE/L43A